MRAWGRALAVLVAATTVTGSTTTATADEADRPASEEVSTAQAEDAAPAAMLSWPDLGVAHRLPAGGLNLWRIPLSHMEASYGQPQLVKTLDFGGFSYDNSRTVQGDFGDLAPSDDGTADHLIWHAQPNGGVLLWAVGGGSGGTPQLWQDLRTGGWSYASSRPMVGDVNGDGLDDLVVQHRNGGGFNANIWVFLSDGQRLGPPQLWTAGASWHPGYRYLLSDVNADGRDDLVEVSTIVGASGYFLAYVGRLSDGSSSFTGWHLLFEGPSSAGWSFAASRQLAGDVTGDGWADLLTVHAQPNGGILIWMHRGTRDLWTGVPALHPPALWQDLRTGGWSFAGSRQYLADSDNNDLPDLITVHSQSGNAGLLLWRHPSSGGGLRSPEVIADLRTGGWSYSSSRAGVGKALRS